MLLRYLFSILFQSSSIDYDTEKNIDSHALVGEFSR